MKHALSAYQLLVCIDHDEYWTAGMRDTVEGFLASGGNVAFLTGNTYWWQFRWEDDGATFVCYRDATEDPLAGMQDRLVRVEWSSAPVNRPENHLTGVSFRRGAGHWAPGGDGAMDDLFVDDQVRRPLGLRGHRTGRRRFLRAGNRWVRD